MSRKKAFLAAAALAALAVVCAPTTPADAVRGPFVLASVDNAKSTSPTNSYALDLAAEGTAGWFLPAGTTGGGQAQGARFTAPGVTVTVGNICNAAAPTPTWTWRSILPPTPPGTTTQSGCRYAAGNGSTALTITITNTSSSRLSVKLLVAVTTPGDANQTTTYTITSVGAIGSQLAVAGSFVSNRVLTDEYLLELDVPAGSTATPQTATVSIKRSSGGNGSLNYIVGGIAMSGTGPCDSVTTETALRDFIADIEADGNELAKATFDAQDLLRNGVIGSGPPPDIITPGLDTTIDQLNDGTFTGTYKARCEILNASYQAALTSSKRAGANGYDDPEDQKMVELIKTAWTGCAPATAMPSAATCTTGPIESPASGPVPVVTKGTPVYWKFEIKNIGLFGDIKNPEVTDRETGPLSALPAAWTCATTGTRNATPILDGQALASDSPISHGQSAFCVRQPTLGGLVGWLP
jgi:hypothetical protein